MITELCDQLLKELEIARSPLLAYFQPGISKKNVEGALLENNIDLTIPSAVYALYAWRNGLTDEIVDSKASGEVRLFQLATFTSLNIAIQNYLAPDLKNLSWSKHLFPLFDSFAGDFYLIDTNEKSDTFKMIMFYSPANPYFENCVSIFDSLETCLTTVAECYREKAYCYIPGSPYLEINPRLELSIWKKNNPNSEYYKIMKIS
jgi:hypothetical protein